MVSNKLSMDWGFQEIWHVLIQKKFLKILDKTGFESLFFGRLAVIDYFRRIGKESEQVISGKAVSDLRKVQPSSNPTPQPQTDSSSPVPRSSGNPSPSPGHQQITQRTGSNADTGQINLP